MKRNLQDLALRGLLAAGLLALSACADLARPTLLTYESDPPGAMLLEGGKEIGMAPQTRRYEGEDPNSALVRTPLVTAVWPSGAKTEFWTELRRGADNVATLQRPDKAAGREQDEQYGAKVKAERDAEKARQKDALDREMKRDSARCKQQMQSGNLATNDC